MTNHETLTINGKPVEFFKPTGKSVHFALLFLHDADGKNLRDWPQGQVLLNAHGLACVCPQGGSSWWSSKICPPFDRLRSAEQWLIDDVVPAVREHWSLGPNALAVAGVGMGGQGALRLAFKHPLVLPVTAAIDAAVDHHELYGSGSPLDEMYPSREHCRQDTAILHIHPARQPGHIWFGVDPRNRWLRGNDRLHEKLSALGIAHTFKIGPSASSADEMGRFIVEALMQESRRLL